MLACAQCFLGGNFGSSAAIWRNCATSSLDQKDADGVAGREGYWPYGRFQLPPGGDEELILFVWHTPSGCFGEKTCKNVGITA